MDYSAMKLKQEAGFTLIELLVALLLSAFIMAGLYAAYRSQQDSYLAQEQVAEMQQNLRAALELMMADIRMAGYDPTKKAGASILTATASDFELTRNIGNGVDDDGDGEIDEADENTLDDLIGTPATNEQVRYAISYDDLSNGSGADGQWAGGTPGDADGDGTLDSSNHLFTLARESGGAGGLQPIAENIEGIEFYYTLNDDTQTLTPLDPGAVRTIEVALLARADQADRKFTHRQSYTTPSGVVWGPFNDNYRRRYVTMTIQARNMGL
ncbi:PilW family protein [Desulfogranum marinum]|uniref:PilW family protein n=1 Tax=Desulfogranum marinum TaxID=453220 RepID=UPI0029C77375|nr:PilW family protein [Desulfogranum marinum]